MLVKDLKKMAKEKGLKGYSRLTKAELIDLLRLNLAPRRKKFSNSSSKAKKLLSNSNPLDEPNPEINVRILKPTMVKTTNPKKAVEKTLNKTVNWLKWLASTGENVEKKVSTKLNAFKNKSTSFIRNILIQLDCLRLKNQGQRLRGLQDNLRSRADGLTHAVFSKKSNHWS